MTLYNDDDGNYLHNHDQIQHPDDRGGGGRHPGCEDTQSLSIFAIIRAINTGFLKRKRFLQNLVSVTEVLHSWQNQILQTNSSQMFFSYT